ncbi:uroporphyrinogen-III synthase [Piscibacillus salipiscarius]|nr:uroporphyrinogen-III synthase [Piscibacillus salipiscarius]
MSQLKGKTLFISREFAKAQDFIVPLKEHGVNVIAYSLITFELEESVSHRETINQFNQFDWVVFTSANGVRYFFETLDNHAISPSEIQHIKKAVVGSKTKEALEQYGVQAHFLPEIYDAEHF